jgi:hypothetical protein
MIVYGTNNDHRLGVMPVEHGAREFLEGVMLLA